MATATPDDITLTALTALGLLFCSAAVPAPRHAVYVHIATTVPTKKVPRNAMACSLGNAKAGRSRSNESG